jgi:ubiquitin-like modifier-activating enzyme ATG7
VKDSESSNPVGLVPHQIRGFLGGYSNMLICGSAYDKCTACSEPVLQGYLADPFGFVLNACGNPEFLEDLTGLTDMKNEEVDWANDDFDGFESDFSMESSNDTKSVEFEK